MKAINFTLFFLCFSLVSSSLGFVQKIFSGEARDYDDNNYGENPCESVKVMPRIVGGAPVKRENSAPYIAAIGERLSNGSISWFCGGSILTPMHVLTAAHCLRSRKPDVVRVGSFKLNTNFSESDYEASEFIIHPMYNAPKSYNDVAVIKLSKKINFVENIKPVCLADREAAYQGKKAKVMGWGAKEVGGDGSQRLQQVEVQIVNNSYCDQAYQNSTISTRSFPEGVHDGQLCAGSPKGGKDACQGDSGGPLVLADNEGVTRQIGIVSTGAGCGAKVYPGVYARVTTYIKWIRENVDSEFWSQKNEVNKTGRLPLQGRKEFVFQ